MAATTPRILSLSGTNSPAQNDKRVAERNGFVGEHRLEGINGWPVEFKPALHCFSRMFSGPAEGKKPRDVQRLPKRQLPGRHSELNNTIIEVYEWAVAAPNALN
jgi:hypothetical protein